MQKKNIYVILIVILVLLNLTVLLVYNTREKKCFNLIKRLKKEVDVNEAVIKEFNTLQQCNWLLASEAVHGNTVLQDSKKKELLLKSLYCNNLIIFYFNSNMCTTCVEKELKNLNKLYEMWKPNKLILLCSGYSHKYVFNSHKYKQWKDYIYLLKKQNYYSKISLTPSMTLIDSTGRILSTYHAGKISNIYFDNFTIFLKRIHQSNKSY